MNDWFFKRIDRVKVIDWLGLDSKINHTITALGEATVDAWNAASSFFARFQLTGWRRVLNELASECVTLAAVGFVAVYAMALPAFLEFDEGKFLTGRYSVTFLDASGNELGKRGILHNDAVPLKEIPDVLVRATLATEDRRFYEHYGIDVFGTFRALMTNIQANDVVQGGSTLTQQLAKNLFLSSERSLERKIKELFLSFLLESRFTKQEILKLYFDRAYMGGGAFGVEAAAQYYFGKTVRDVNMAEAALMAGLFKAPSRYAPHINIAASRARTNEVLDNMIEAGYYTSGQVHAARVRPAPTIEHNVGTSPDWYLDWAFEEVQRIAEGSGEYVLTARTTVDMSLQAKADEAVRAAVRRSGRSHRINASALVSMERDGAVRAMVGGLDYGESQFNRATQSRRQPGSSFKVYVYAAALENGYTPNTTVRDRSRACGRWVPRNYGGGYGSGRRMPMWLAMAKSYNTIAAETSFAVGREKVIDLTKRLGIPNVKKTCSMALGDGGISVLDQTGAFAVFANNGVRAPPYAILDITTSKGELLYSHERDAPKPKRVVSERVAHQINQMMEKVVTSGTGGRAALEYTNVVGKTGTSTGPKDAWFMGFTGKYVTGVWLGNDDNRPMTGKVTGGGFAAPLWHSFMNVAHTDMNIPTIPGLKPHPVQIQEQQRIAEERARAIAAGLPPPGSEQKTAAELARMPDKTRATLRKLNSALREAAGLPPAPSDDTPPSDRTNLQPPDATRNKRTGSLRQIPVNAAWQTDSNRQPSGGVR